MAQALIDFLNRRFPAAVIEAHSQRGDDTVVIDPRFWFDVHAALRDDESTDMQMLVDLTAVDFPERSPRFEVVTHLLSLRLGHRIRVKTRVGDVEGEHAEVATLTPLWGSANWSERECYDLMGIRFVGHPDLRRLLLYPEFEGHPLRKDYPADKTQPLIAYRDVDNTGKLPPFGPDEGMSFGRQTHHQARVTDEERD
ncbi:MAG TPA: NADH-quinone oxidoreductase subunit C [Polyangiaceae bacterium]|nr:NADH-quinone oxidoreductase subunit C [Polyangiaceae bacterium]